MNLFIFNEILNDPVISALLCFRETGDEAAYYSAAQGLIAYSERRLTDRDIIREYVLRTMLEQNNLPDITHLRNFLRRDVKNIYSVFFETDWDELFRRHEMVPLNDIEPSPKSYDLSSYIFSLTSMIDCTSNEALGGAILAHAEIFGTGISVSHSALIWNGFALEGVKHPDPVCFRDLTGLSYQKQVLLDNTEAFVIGKRANDILLSGNIASGKSSCVKACLNSFKDSGLRLIELRNTQLDELPEILNFINNDILKYIIFIDNLSCKSPDFCSFLSGTAEFRRNNVLIYAVSSGTVSADLKSRFGINLDFPPQTQEEYLQTVEKNLSKNGISITAGLKKDAIAWANNTDGFSGRCAEQYVTSILSKQ